MEHTKSPALARTKRIIALLLAAALWMNDVGKITAITYDAATLTYFDVIDDYGQASGGTSIGLQFGGTLGEFLRFDQTTGKFVLTDDLDVQGTISGSRLTIMGNASISGALTIEGGSAALSGSVLRGFGLSADCDTAGTSKLLWDATTGRFSCGTDQGTTYTAGQGLSLNGNVFSLNQTVTGSTVFAQSTLATSGTLLVENTDSGDTRHLIVADSASSLASTVFMNHTGHDSASDGLSAGIYHSNGFVLNREAGPLWFGSNNQMQMGIGSNGNVGIIPDTAFDPFLDVGADAKLEVVGTISGSSIVQQGPSDNSFTGNVGINTNSPGSRLSVYNGMDFSGTDYLAEFTGSDPNANKKGLYVGVRGNSTVIDRTLITASGSTDLVFGTTLTPEAMMIADAGNVSIGTTVANAKLDVAGTVSGASIIASTSLRGAGLSDCDTAGTSKLLWDATTGRFSCGTDQTGGSSLTAGQGLSLNASTLSLSSSISGTLLEFQTVSGATIIQHGSNATNLFQGTVQIAPNGTTSTSTATPSTIDMGGTYADTVTSSKAKIKLYNDGTPANTFGIGVTSGQFNFFTNAGANYAWHANSTETMKLYNVGDLQILRHFTAFGNVTAKNTISGAALTVNGTNNNYIVGNVGIGSRATPDTKLEVVGTISGTSLFTSSFNQDTGLADCDNATTSKLLWDAATGRFSCGTDQTGGSSGGGLDYATASGIFLKRSGGTMTGGLTVLKSGSTTDRGITVAQHNDGIHGAPLLFMKSRGTVTSPSTVASGDYGGFFQYGFYTGGTNNGGYTRTATIATIVNGTVSTSNGGTAPTDIVFAAGSTDDPNISTTERMRITATGNVGIATSSPHSTFTASGSFATRARIMTATGSINGHDNVIFASGSSMISITLPSAVGIAGRQYTIKKTSSPTATDSRPVIVKTTSSQTIDRLSQWRMTIKNQEVTVVSDGSNWQVFNGTSSYGINGGYMAIGTTMNQWYGASADATALTTAVLTTTATIRVLPFVANRVMTINGMAVSVQTTAASAQVRVGLYNDNGRGYPDQLVVDAGTVATTTTGVRTICPSGCTTTGDNVLPVTIQPGLYWIAINNNAIAHTLRGYAVANLNPQSGFPSNYTTLRNVGWQIANSYAALPSIFPSGATATTAVPLPAVTMRMQE